MWVRKNEIELQEQKAKKKRFPFGAVVFCGILLSLVMSIFWLIGMPGRFGHPTEPISFQELVEELPFILCFSFIFVSVMVIIGMRQKRKTYICPKCDKTRTDINMIQCECGEKFVDLDKMKWVD